MAALRTSFRSCTLAIIGRELAKSSSPDGTVSYGPSEEMRRRANEAGMFWQANIHRVSRIRCIGGFPGAALGMRKPPEGINEGTCLRNILVEEWSVPPEIIGVEGESDNTFDNFWECIRQGLLTPGEFNPDNALVLSTNTFHAWRLGILAVPSLLIPENSLYRLRPGNLEGPHMRIKEHRLAKVTQVALEDVIARGEIKQGHPDLVKHVQARFRELWLEGGADRRERVLAEFDAARGVAWLPPTIPVLDYPGTAYPPRNTWRVPNGPAA